MTCIHFFPRLTELARDIAAKSLKLTEVRPDEPRSTTLNYEIKRAEKNQLSKHLSSSNLEKVA